MSTVQIFLSLFLTLFAVRFLLERGLAILNTKYVLSKSREIPKILKGTVSQENYRQSINYTLTRTRFGHLEDAVGSILTLVYLFSGFIPWLYSQAQGLLPLGELGQCVILILIFTILNSLVGLPLEMYETFVIENRFGFNKTTPSTFWLDKLKSLILLFLIGIPFFYFLFIFITRTGPFWWLAAALFVMGFQFLMMILYPIVIAPFFNKFTPLEEGELKIHLENLAKKCQFAACGIFVIDGSKRSSHSNAYFTGIGKARRIVLFDTLIQQLAIGELSAVLAHEIGHYKKKHILKILILSSSLTVIGFYILSLLLNWQPMYQAFGITDSSVAVKILIFSLVGGAFTFWLGPFFNALSRKHEYEADRYAAEQTGQPQTMESALIKLSEKNLSNLTPHPAYSTYHYSHPTLVERITALRR